MFLVLFLCVSAIPLSYFRSEKPSAWNPPQVSFFENSYQREHPLVPFPVVPFWGFGFRFDGDIMISLADDGPWGMIEIAYAQTKQGEKIWFTLDSRLDGRQYIGLSDHPLSHEIASLFPIPSYQAQLQVLEQDGQYIVSYKRGEEPIAFSIPIDDRVRPPSAQNGHAMNHSQHDMMAILHISSLRLQPVKWINTDLRAQSIFWQPISGLMSQTVAGLRRGAWKQSKTEIHKQAMQTQSVESKECIQTAHTTYCFHKKGDERQLQTISMFQPLHDDEIASVVFSPALPDFRFIPLVDHCSDAFWKLKNQEHLRGKVCVHPLHYGSSMVVTMHSQKPSWAKRRPVLTLLRFDQEQQEVYADSMILSDGAQDMHTLGVSVSDVSEVMIAHNFLWNGTALIPQSRQEKKEARAYTAVIPLVPKGKELVGTVEFTSSFVHPFLLGLKVHMLPSIEQFSFHVDASNGTNRITLRMTPSKAPEHGGWAEVDIGEVVSSQPIQSMVLQGRKGGLIVDEPLFLNSLSLRTKDCSFALNGFLNSSPQGCMSAASMFWIHE